MKLSNAWKFSNIFSNEIVKSVVEKRFRRKEIDFFMNELKKLVDYSGEIKIKNKIYFYCCFLYIFIFYLSEDKIHFHM